MVSRSATFASAWLGANSQSMNDRLTRLGSLAVTAPLQAVGWVDATMANRLTWMPVRGMSEDRLLILGEEYWATWLEDALLDVGRTLIKRARSEGRRVVLISDHLRCMIDPLQEAVGADDLLANTMSFRDGKATGRLVDPVMARFGGRALEDYADKQGIDLTRSVAYGSTRADATLLAGVGEACVVNPSIGLARVADELGWPVLEET
jgi:phosphoserine phosphatase